MSKADQIFIDMCRDIIENGTSTEGEKVRPVWEDTGEKAYTIKKRRVKAGDRLTVNAAPGGGYAISIICI